MHALHEIESPFGLADMLNFFEFRFADPRQLETQYLARYDQVAREAVIQQARITLAAPRVTITVARAPGSAGAPADEEAE
jgi:hypothetical protein